MPSRRSRRAWPSSVRRSHTITAEQRDVRDVGVREAAEDRGVQHGAARLRRHRHVHDVLHGLARRRVHERARHHRARAPHHHGRRPRRRARARACAPARCAVSPMSTCGIGAVAGDDGGVVDHAPRSCARGSRGPPRSAGVGATARIRRSSSPSPSSTCSATIAPCSARNAASQPPRTAPTMASHMSSYARLLDVAGRVRAARDGHDDLGAHLAGPRGGSRRAGCWCRGTPATAASPASGRNDASGVGTGEKVLVSCIIIATTIFWRAIDGLPQGAAG